ncbi:MAG TPA: LytR C-terminal domain-containing protein [Ilumatobacteraceae bacterium]|nr:LytR C-terminal domain-containing protein [Ilumatobacteraceae bacterium]
MSSDVPEGSGPGPVGRRPRAGDGGAPASGALAIVLAIVAVVAGFLILRSINDDDDGDVGEDTDGTLVSGETTTTTLAGSVTTLPVVTSTTEPALVLDPNVTVIVANASNVNGSAAQMTRALEVVGYTMGDPTDRAASTPQLEASVVYFDPAVPNSDAVAQSVARSLGGVDSISAVAVPAPTASGELGGAGVLVMLGIDKAGKTLDELTGATADTTPTGATSPPVAGGTTPDSTTAP